MSNGVLNIVPCNNSVEFKARVLKGQIRHLFGFFSLMTGIWYSYPREKAGKEEEMRCFDGRIGVRCRRRRKLPGTWHQLGKKFRILRIKEAGENILPVIDA